MRERAFGAVRRRDRERGQALVEFALILPLFLMIVVGIIQFGLALNFWLDMQRIANQGARWAVVNEYPGCPRSGPNTLACGTSTTLQEYLANERVAQGENLDVSICFPSGTSTAGQPVKVKITQPLNFLAVVTFFRHADGSDRGLSFDLHAEATMRLEQTPGRYAADGPC
ncbi:MAG: pilus assembly protein [Chloroflexota bacterium]|nr:pilus assembly protein [Chloroflexota bacterium]